MVVVLDSEKAHAIIRYVSCASDIASSVLHLESMLCGVEGDYIVSAEGSECASSASMAQISYGHSSLLT